MRREPEHFGERELEIVQLSRRLAEARRVERVLDEAGVDYVLEVATYQATLLFLIPVSRHGVYFHVEPSEAEAARRLLTASGLSVVEVLEEEGVEPVDGARTGEAETGEAETGEAKPGGAKPGEAKPGGAKPGEAVTARPDSVGRGREPS